MWWKRARLAASAVVALGLATLGCGREIPAGGVAAPTFPDGPRVVRRLDPADIIPADLDLVVRVDMGRMRAALGPGATKALVDRVGEQQAADGGAGEALLGEALAKADVVWIATRVADVLAGDRMLVAQGKMDGITPGPEWRSVPSANGEIAVWERPGDVPRAATARVVALGKRALAFVSPVEVASVARVLRDGPDEKRGDPSAEGMISADLRARRLPPALELRFPSFAAIVAGIERIRATVTLVDEGAKLEAKIVCDDAGAADRALRFLLALRDNVEDPRYADAIKAAKLEQTGAIVDLTWIVPTPFVLAMLAP